jgi:hypothetical protein
MGFAALSVVARHLRDALQLVDIRVLDHLIVAGDHEICYRNGRPLSRRKDDCTPPRIGSIEPAASRSVFRQSCAYSRI